MKQIIMFISLITSSLTLGAKDHGSSSHHPSSIPQPNPTGISQNVKQSVKIAEAKTLEIFYPLYEKILQSNHGAIKLQAFIYAIKILQTQRAPKNFFNPQVRVGEKAPLDNFDPQPCKENLLFISSFAFYNNKDALKKEDLIAFQKAYPHLIPPSVNLKTLEGPLLPPINNKKIQFNPYSFGMLMVYRLRNKHLLKEEDLFNVDLTNKEGAFEFEKNYSLQRKQ